MKKPKKQKEAPDIYKAWPKDHAAIKLLLLRANHLLKFAIKKLRQGNAEAGKESAVHAYMFCLSASWLRCALNGDFDAMSPAGKKLIAELTRKKS